MSSDVPINIANSIALSLTISEDSYGKPNKGIVTCLFFFDGCFVLVSSPSFLFSSNAHCNSNSPVKKEGGMRKGDSIMKARYDVCVLHVASLVYRIPRT